MAKIILVSNKVPSIPETDRATWTRVRVIPFISTFVDEKEYTVLNDRATVPDAGTNEKHIYVRDMNVSNRIRHLAPVFMWMLVEEYKNYERFGLEEPNIVTESTKYLRKSNDIIGEFLEEYTIRDKGSRCHREVLYDRYKFWLKSVHPRTAMIELPEFIIQVKKHDYFQDFEGRFVGLSLRENNEIIAD